MVFYSWKVCIKSSVSDRILRRLLVASIPVMFEVLGETFVLFALFVYSFVLSCDNLFLGYIVFPGLLL